MHNIVFRHFFLGVKIHVLHEQYQRCLEGVAELCELEIRDHIIDGEQSLSSRFG